MNEISQVLEKSEKVVWAGNPKYSAYITPTLILLILATIIGTVLIVSKLVVWYLFILYPILILIFILVNLSYRVTYYAITSKRVVVQSGIIGRDFKSINFDNIQNASVDVGLIGIIFKVGTIKIFTGEMQSVNVGKSSQMRPKYDKFSYIPNAYDTLKLLQENLSSREENLYGGKS